MKTIQLTIDDRNVTVAKGTKVLGAIKEAGVYVPTLCDDPLLRPYGHVVCASSGSKGCEDWSHHAPHLRKKA